MLDAAAYSTMFLYENWLSFWKEYFLVIIIFMVEGGSFCPRWTGLSKLKKYTYLYN
jgi:hypothetical protein